MFKSEGKRAGPTELRLRDSVHRRRLATWAWESHSGGERFKTRTLSASHQYTCFGTLSVALCAQNDSGVLFTTIRHASGVCVSERETQKQHCCVWRVCRIKAGLGACTDQPTSDAKSKLCSYTQDACVVPLIIPHPELSFAYSRL